MSSVKRNQTFNYLYCLAIIMVIDDHTSTSIGLLSNIFPYNSFYMPLFVFCSGYFYKKSKVVDNITHKVKKLFIPYIVWNVVAEILSFIIDMITGVKWFRVPTPDRILKCIISQPLSTWNGASWFVIMLFWVSIIYNLLQQRVKEDVKEDIFMTALFCFLGFSSTILCVIGYCNNGMLWVFLLKTLFYIQFYHYGYMFKKYVEHAILKVNKILICSICVLINVLAITYRGNNINFYSTVKMASFKSAYLPLITSISGIIFYYILMEFLARKIGEIKIVDFIAKNTFIIMQTHLFFANIPSFFVYFSILAGSTKYRDFDIDEFRRTAWFRYNTTSQRWAFFCALAGSLVVAYLIEIVKKKKKTIAM